MFRVYISGNNETSKRCHLNGAYNLLVEDSRLCLCDLTSNRVLYKSPYKYIRRYGKTRSSFHFEAGRKSSSGEGIFDMETNQGSEIFRRVVGKWKTPTEKVQTRGMSYSDGCEGIQSADDSGLKDEEQRVAGAAESHTYANIIGARQGSLDVKKAEGTVGVYSEPYTTDTGDTYLTAVAEKQYYNKDTPDGNRAGRPPKSDDEHVYSEPYTS
ncbi:uncharacterized protein [Haliotis asinina]|uniref:uncharacterized protein n=1 Tax=Haliotis asinina TaxID=109174 RepID=UPI003532652A